MINWQEITKKIGFRSTRAMLKSLYVTQKCSTDFLAGVFHVSDNSVSNALRRYGIPLRSKGGANNVRDDIIISEEQYRSCTIRELCQMFKCSSPTVLDRTRQYPRKSPKKSHPGGNYKTVRKEASYER